MPRPRKTTTPTVAEAIINLSASTDDTNVNDASEPTDTPKARRTRKPRASKAHDVSPETLAAVHDKVAASAVLVGMTLPDGLRLTDTEIDGIFVPLERIGLRHMPDPLKNAGPDQRDAFDALGNAFAYLLRAFVFPTLQRLSMQRRTKPTPQQTQPTPERPPATPTAQRTRPPMSLEMRDALSGDKTPDAQLGSLHDMLINQSHHVNSAE